MESIITAVEPDDVVPSAFFGIDVRRKAASKTYGETQTGQLGWMKEIAGSSRRSSSQPRDGKHSP